MVLELAILGIFPTIVALAGSFDLFTMKIPNWMPLALAAGFFCLAPFIGLEWTQFAAHVGVGAAMLLAGILFFARGWIGGGDAKLFAATALWVGHEHILHYAALAAIAGGVLTVFILLARSLPLPAALARQQWLARLHDSGNGVPYGIALAIGALVVYPHTVWMSALI